MRRYWLRLLFVPALFFAIPLSAEVDRKQKEEEEEKEARPELDVDSGEDSHKKFHERLAKEGEENLEEIQRLLDEINDNLGKRDTGSGTQSKQRQAVERMKKLIGELSKGCKQCQGGGSGSSSKSSGQKQNKPDQKEGKGEQKQQKQARKNQKLPSEKQRQKRQQGQKEDNREKVPNDRVAEDRKPDSGKARISARLRKIARWGLLPLKVREEVLSSAGKDTPPEYREIIERYYKRISDYYEKRLETE